MVSTQREYSFGLAPGSALASAMYPDRYPDGAMLAQNPILFKAYQGQSVDERPAERPAEKPAKDRGRGWW